MSKERLEQALSNWQEKLAEYEYELSIACSSAEKFHLKKIIEECWEEIRRIETKIRSFQVPSNEEFFKPYRVLVVEDEEVNRDMITLALEEEGYEVEKTGHPRKALDLLVHKPRFNLILLDLMLPEINGLDLCRFLRARGDPIMILILTAKRSETDRVLGLEVGADDYLTKPFSMRELVARCRALLRRQSFTIRPLTAVRKFRDITLLSEEGRVLLRGEEVNLSPKEYGLLELFMNYPRRVWSREQLIDQVWGLDFLGDIKTVDVHIRWLREKLEKDPNRPEYLINVRGFGYRFG